MSWSSKNLTETVHNLISKTKNNDLQIIFNTISTFLSPEIQLFIHVYVYEWQRTVKNFMFTEQGACLSLRERKAG